MQMIVKCPRCGGSRRLQAEAADKRIRCTKCRKLFKVPEFSELAKAKQIIKQAKGTIHVDESGKLYG